MSDWPAPAADVREVLVADDFADTSTTNLQAHTPTGTNAGGSWTRHSASSGSNGVISNANRVRAAASTDAFYIQRPAIADAVVRATLVAKSVLGFGGVLGRWDNAATAGLFAFLDGGNFTAANILRLYRYGGAGTAELGTYTIPGGIVVDQAYEIALEMRGSLVRVYLDGVERISTTDTSLQKFGHGGVRVSSGGATASDTTTIHVDNFSYSAPA